MQINFPEWHDCIRQDSPESEMMIMVTENRQISYKIPPHANIEIKF